MKNILFAFLLFVSFSAFCGTIIYRGTDNEKKIISEIDIVSIDKNIVTIKIGKTTRTLHFSKIYKYYDTDINMNLAFDDNTSDYTLAVTNLKLPVNKKGVTQRAKKQKQKNKIEFDFSLSPQRKKGQSANVKVPYFYLYLLTSSGKGNGSSIYTYFHPNTAKIKNSKVYNEALMLESAISSERQIINPRYLSNISREGQGNKVAIDISKIGERKIIAYYLVVWGKDDIVYTDNKIIDHSYEVSKNWYLLHRSKK